MYIIGAGLAGLLAANMLQHRKPEVIERQPSLPNNHSAVLRFKSSVVGDVLNIPFKKVKMIKAPVPWLNPVADAMAYSFKNTGKRRSDRSITQGMVAEDRYIAPPDLISRMAERCLIYFGSVFDPSIPPITKFAAEWAANNVIISTMPMPTLMEQLNYPKREQIKFEWMSGVNVRAKISNTDAYISLLVPEPGYPFSRISITGDELILECPGMTSVSEHYLIGSAAEMLGLGTAEITDVKVTEQRYAKILPIDDEVRKEFMHWATVNHNVYSLGRFATWRPNLLLDDLVQDIRLIDKWSSMSSKYDVARAKC